MSVICNGCKSVATAYRKYKVKDNILFEKKIIVCKRCGGKKEYDELPIMNGNNIIKDIILKKA